MIARSLGVGPTTSLIVFSALCTLGYLLLLVDAYLVFRDRRDQS